MEFETVIGLEVHAQLATQSKIWCTCEINPLSLENTKVCEICSAQPGSLPVINKKVVEYAGLLALATHSKINPVSYFDRKNYFYPDLPKGYQITQYQTPIAVDGYIEIELDGKKKKIGIERIQIEEDTGKSTHEGEYSLINLNRCGTPLLEIVGKPDIRNPKEASLYLKKLHSILTYLDICHGNLQEGNFRCDVNVSLRDVGTTKFGTRTEVKNLNSFRYVEKAIETESERQKEILKSGQKVIQQTLNFDPIELKIKPLRTKSDAHDYRYFPEPDLLTLTIEEEEIKKWEKNLPELPEQKASRFCTQYQISPYDAEVLTGDKDFAAYFEKAQSFHKGEAKKLANWMMTELLKLLNEFSINITKSPVDASNLAELMNAIFEGKISGKQGKDVFQKMFDEKMSASSAISALGLVQLSDSSEIEKVAQKVIDSNPQQVEQYLGGKDKLFGFFVGQLMKETKGQANPQMANEAIKKALSNLKK